MSEIKHTSGPWILATVPTSVGSCHKIGPFPGAGIRPHTFACVYADGIRVGIDEALPAAIELAANARLIAAAPDMFDALESIRSRFTKAIALGLSAAEAYDSFYQEIVDEAIAKATGNQS